MIFDGAGRWHRITESNPVIAKLLAGGTRMRVSVWVFSLCSVAALSATLVASACSPLTFNTEGISLAAATADLRVPGETTLEFMDDAPKMSFAASYHVCQFTGEAGDIVQIVIEGPRTYVHVVLYDGQRQELGRAIVRADQRKPTINFVPPRTGTYYLVVAGNR